MGQPNPWTTLLYVEYFASHHVCVQLPTSVVNVTLPAFAGERRAAVLCPAPTLSIDMSRPHGAQQQTRGTPRQKGGRTLDRYIDPARNFALSKIIVRLS